MGSVDKALKFTGCGIREVASFEFVEVGDLVLQEVTDGGAEDVAGGVKTGEIFSLSSIYVESDLIVDLERLAGGWFVAT
jgi:hypothetical protein